MIFTVSAVNQQLISAGVCLRISVVVDTGQVESSHHLAAILGFGAAAVHPHTVARRAPDEEGFARWRKGAEKSLCKTMGRVGLCTVESYIGGEFFEPAFLDTAEQDLHRWFPNLRAPVGGVGLQPIVEALGAAHSAAMNAPVPAADADLPLLGLFKERAEGAGHSFGAAAVRGYAPSSTRRSISPRREANRRKQRPRGSVTRSACSPWPPSPTRSVWVTRSTRTAALRH